MSEQEDKRFLPFDRQPDADCPLEELLAQFRTCRAENLRHLETLALQKDDLIKTAHHPDFGQVTLAQLLSTWTVHDLSHIAQIARIMARQYAEAVGPWKAFYLLCSGHNN